MRAIFTILALAATALAQTSTICDPLKVSCPADPALGTSFNTTWNGDSSLNDDYWTPDAGGGPSYPSNNTGAAFSVTGKGIAPTITTDFYMFWGHVEVMMKASSGQGIISSIVLLSDDLDEIDWEIMGGNTTHVETNYYGKGNATQMNAIYYPCDDPQADYHNYTINWNAEKVEWILDGNVLRTLVPDDAVDDDGKSMFPQTPMQLKIGSWAGGDPSNPEGTIEWAGGVTDYAKGPYTMLVQSMEAIDGTVNATKYEYGDHSGSWESIKVTK